MLKLRPVLAAAARSPLPIVITGQQGTGKKHLARILHDMGPGGSGPFVVRVCAAPGAEDERRAERGVGCPRELEVARGGTLVLDTVSQLDVRDQLRIASAMGAVAARTAPGGWPEVRVICVARRPPELDVSEGRLREELYYSTAGFRIDVPSLRERPEDIERAARVIWFAHRPDSAGPPRAFLELLVQQDWPGNFSELSSVVRRALAALAVRGEVPSDKLFEAGALIATREGGAPRAPGSGADSIGRTVAQRMRFADAKAVVLREFERRYCEALLKEHDGNVTRAAAAAGLARRSFYVIRDRTRLGAERLR